MKRWPWQSAANSAPSVRDPNRPNSNSTSSRTFRLTNPFHFIATESFSISAPARTSCVPETSARFSLTHVASAYYKGDEKNPQLQRIYGTAFKNKTQLDEYFAMLEEAKKRDHRKLGKELEIFIFDDDVGPGLPLWLPRGAAMIEELEKLAKETEFAAGYQRVRSPHIARESLYQKSGHLPYYADSMFPPMSLRLKAVRK